MEQRKDRYGVLLAYRDSYEEVRISFRALNAELKIFGLSVFRSSGRIWWNNKKNGLALGV